MGARMSRTTDAYDTKRAEHQQELGCFGVFSRVVRRQSRAPLGGAASAVAPGCIMSTFWPPGSLFQLTHATYLRLCVSSQLSIKPASYENSCGAKLAVRLPVVVCTFTKGERFECSPAWSACVNMHVVHAATLFSARGGKGRRARHAVCPLF